MSAFLGPIHFWLYNKIGNQELLTKEIAALAAAGADVFSFVHILKSFQNNN